MLNLVCSLSEEKLTDFLERDDKDAIDESNIIKGDRLRHAKPAGGKYREKEEDDLPEEAQ